LLCSEALLTTAAAAGLVVVLAAIVVLVVKAKVYAGQASGIGRRRTEG
jgi:hypothetical protein